jgi:hypothetical protein
MSSIPLKEAATNKKKLDLKLLDLAKALNK